MYLIPKIHVPMQSYYFKLLNMWKFAHGRKIHLSLESNKKSFVSNGSLKKIKFTPIIYTN